MYIYLNDKAEFVYFLSITVKLKYYVTKIHKIKYIWHYNKQYNEIAQINLFISLQDLNIYTFYIRNS